VQGARGPDRAMGGLGLGLSLVRTLTELHGGTVSARSDGPGRGSEFVVRLPAAAPEAEHPRTPAPAKPTWQRAPGERDTRVLVVDDNRDVADLIARLLRVAGYETQTTYDPVSALMLATDFRPEIAILDIGLPVMDGYALGRELRARLPGAEPTLIAVTGYSQTRDRQRSADAGFALHVEKPIDAEKLVHMVDELPVGKRRTSVRT
jgi:CheY-like chemotaxis protein